MSESTLRSNSPDSEQPLSKPWQVLTNLSQEKLEILQRRFEKNRKGLNQAEFYEALKNIIEDQTICQQIFTAISPNNSSLTWSTFLDFLLEIISQSIRNKLKLSIRSITAVPQTKRESIVKIVTIETAKFFCYVIIAKHGKIGLYDGALNFLISYQVIMTREDINRSEEARRRRNRWVTDGLFTPDTLHLIFTTSARSLIIYEASGLKHVPLYLVLSTPNIVESLAYKSAEDSTYLFLGDNQGEIIVFEFRQPKSSLLRKKSDSISLFYWTELAKESKFVTISYKGKIHEDAISYMEYFQELDTLMSCSRDPVKSLVRRPLDNKRKPDEFKMPKGANIFAIAPKLNLLLTGSHDGTIRIWNLLLNSIPIAVLKAHKTSIISLQILENVQVFLSLSTDSTLKLWHLTEHYCLQTLNIKFPCLKVSGKLIEWAKNPIYPGAKRFNSEQNQGTKLNACFDLSDFSEKSLESKSDSIEIGSVWERSNILVTCCNFIANITLKFDDVQLNDKFQQAILPPPPLQNSVLIPSTWKISAVPINFISTPTSCEQIDKYIKELSFILDQDLLDGQDGLQSDINYKVAVLEQKKLEIKKYVAQGAPYLALDIFDIEELTLSEDLPVSNRKKSRTFLDKIKQTLTDASMKDQIFSEPSSSRSKSSKSSIVEFPL